MRSLSWARTALSRSYSARRAAHALGRLRWVTKWRLVRQSESRPLEHLRYVLLDPEVESFSYDLANEQELVEHLAAVFTVDRESVQRYVDETRHDPELTELLANRTRWRPHLKRRQALGNRLLWYAIARILKPQVVVETGIYRGLGSLALLVALNRNAQEGYCGELVSVDADPRAGQLVPRHLRQRWTKVTGKSADVLDGAVAGRTIDLFFQDTPHTPENQELEFDVALRHAAARLVIVEGSGGYCPTLAELAERLNVQRHHFREQPLNHFYKSPGSAYVIVEAE